MGLREWGTDQILSLINITFVVYLKVATVFVQATLPLFKDGLSKKFRNYGVTNDRFYVRAILEKHLGVFESYVDGDWNNDDLVGLFTRTLLKRAKPTKHVHPLSWTLTYFNLQSRQRAWQIGEMHYDIGNDLFEKMLDTNMQYSCGYWKNAQNLEEAQIAKMELIGQKLKLKPGMRVLDIGCGFGTLAVYLAKHFGVEVVGCSVSKAQTNFGDKLRTQFNLSVEFRLSDYRDLNEQFDRIVSVGMFEHVGRHNYREFLQVAHRCLKEDGLFLLHTIGLNHHKIPGAGMWIHKHIFRNGELPYYLNVCKTMEDLWVIEDWHNFGMDYAKTLAAWDKNFESAWPELSGKYGDKFYRMWKLYLSISQANFLSRACQLWQIVLSKDGLKEGYNSVR